MATSPFLNRIELTGHPRSIDYSSSNLVTYPRKALSATSERAAKNLLRINCKNTHERFNTLSTTISTKIIFWYGMCMITVNLFRSHGHGSVSTTSAPRPR